MHESIIQYKQQRKNACKLNNHFSVGVHRPTLHGFHALLDSLSLFAILRRWTLLYPLLAKRLAISSTGTETVNGAGSIFISFQRVCWCSLRKERYVLFHPFFSSSEVMESLKSTYLCMHFFLAYLILLGYSSSQSEPDTFTDNQRGLEGLCVRNLFDRSVPHVRWTTHISLYLREKNQRHQGERGQLIDNYVYLQI